MKYYLTILVLIIFNYIVNSQGLVNDGASIIITSSSYVVVDGAGLGNYLNKTNTTDGSIDIDGNMIVKGDWTNNAANNVFINRDGDGTVNFSSSGNQNINGTTKTIFEKLSINNTATEVVLGIDAEVESGLSLSDGVITTGANYLIHSSTIASDLTAFSSASYVNGNYRRYIAAADASTYTLPLGIGTTSTGYQRADFVNDNIAGVTFLNTRVDVITNGGNDIDSRLNTTQDGTSIIDIDESAEWSIVPDGVSGGSYGVRLYVKNLALSVSDDNMFCPVKRNDASTDFADWLTYDATTTIPAQDASGRIYDSGNGYAERLGYTSFSKHAVAKGIHGLPIELLNFNAHYHSGIVNLLWNTANEINNDFFTLEKSNNGFDFNYLGVVDGAGNSNSVQNYSFDDHYPFDGVTYYRLKQTDFDGKYSYSNIESIIINTESKLNVYNIFNSDLETTLFINNTSKEILYLRITDMSGKIIYIEKLNSTNDNVVVELDKGKINSGIYNLYVYNNKEFVIKRIVIL